MLDTPVLQEIKLRLGNLEFPFVRTYSIVTDFQVLASEKSVLLILIAASKSICGAIQLPDASCMHDFPEFNSNCGNQ